MKQIHTTLPDDLERRVKEVSAKKFKYKKGFFQMAIIEALQDWLEHERWKK